VMRELGVTRLRPAAAPRSVPLTAITAGAAEEHLPAFTPMYTMNLSDSTSEPGRTKSRSRPESESFRTTTSSRKAGADAGFTAKANIADALKLGVKDASFTGKGNIEVLEGVSSRKRHKKLQRFRAGVEGIISFTKRCFGFDRCTWRGYHSFQAYAWASVGTCQRI
jgi:hypothetical protein